MTHTIIQTEWPQWDKYLSKYANKKITCLVVGAHNGKYTELLLNNLCMNNYSRVFSVDKWDPTIEKDFDNIMNEIYSIDTEKEPEMQIVKNTIALDLIFKLELPNDKVSLSLFVRMAQMCQ